MRPDKATYYLNIAREVAKRGTCLKRNYGAVIVNNDEIISTGYTGVPRGETHCVTCKRAFSRSGTNYELCRSVHAECNAIISAARRDMIGSTLYLVGIESDGADTLNPTPCSICERMIKNAGIIRVVTPYCIFNFKNGFNTERFLL